jgi:hypothetical protein
MEELRISFENTKEVYEDLSEDEDDQLECNQMNQDDNTFDSKNLKQDLKICIDNTQNIINNNDNNNQDTIEVETLDIENGGDEGDIEFQVNLDRPPETLEILKDQVITPKLYFNESFVDSEGLALAVIINIPIEKNIINLTNLLYNSIKRIILTLKRSSHYTKGFYFFYYFQIIEYI